MNTMNNTAENLEIIAGRSGGGWVEDNRDDECHKNVLGVDFSLRGKFEAEVVAAGFSVVSYFGGIYVIAIED